MTGQAAPIGYGQRVTAIGINGSGKSELIRWLFTQTRVPRTLVDPKGEWEIPGIPRVMLRSRDEDEARAEVRRSLDPAQPLRHVVPEWGCRPQLTALYDWINARPGPHLTWTDEAYGVSTDSWMPPGLRAIQVAGRSRGHGNYVATQRPVDIGKTLLTEADHVFLFPPLDVEDADEALRGAGFLDRWARLNGYTGRRRAGVDYVIDLMHDRPQYGYVWIDKKGQRVDLGDPIPEHLRAAAERQVRRRPQ